MFAEIYLAIAGVYGLVLLGLIWQDREQLYLPNTSVPRKLLHVYLVSLILSEAKRCYGQSC